MARKLVRRVTSAVAVVLVVAGYALLVFTGYQMRQTGDGLLPRHMTDEQSRAFEEKFRRPGTFDEDKRDLQDFMGKTAEEIAKTTGWSWSWRPRVGSESCDMEGDRSEDTPVRKVPTDQIIFDAPIPDRLWAQAVGVVRDRAAGRGMAETRSLYDHPGDHSFEFRSRNGETLELNSRFLLGSTECRWDEVLGR